MRREQNLARVTDPGALQLYTGGKLRRNVVYYLDNRDQGTPNSYEGLLRDMLRLLDRGWQPWGISRDELKTRIVTGLSRKLYQDTWLWELTLARLNHTLGFGKVHGLDPLRIEYVPAARKVLLEQFLDRLRKGDRPAGFVGSGGPWMYPDRLMGELDSGRPDVAHKVGWIIDELHERSIPSFGICLSFQIMAEQLWGRGTKESGVYLLEYLGAPKGHDYEWHSRIRRYSRVDAEKPCFVYGVRNVHKEREDPLMSWVDETPALMVHGMGIGLPTDRIPQECILGVSSRFFSERKRNVTPKTPDDRLWGTRYHVLQAAAFGPWMRGTQFHPELTPDFCLDLSRHPKIACMLTNMDPSDYPAEADLIHKPMPAIIDAARLSRLQIMQAEIQGYPWDRFVTELTSFGGSSRGKKYPAGTAVVYNFCKFFVALRYVCDAYLENRVSRDVVRELISRNEFLTLNQQRLVRPLMQDLNLEHLLA